MNEEQLDIVERDAQATACPCGGYMDLVEPTPEEMTSRGCEKDRAATKRGDKPVDPCCARAFVCRVCKRRMSTSAYAPELGW